MLLSIFKIGPISAFTFAADIQIGTPVGSGKRRSSGVITKVQNKSKENVQTWLKTNPREVHIPDKFKINQTDVRHSQKLKEDSDRQ